MMNPPRHLLAICALLLAGSFGANGQNEDEWGSLNTYNNLGSMVRTNILADREEIYIDEKPQDDEFYGSGDEFINDDMEEDFSSGDDEEEGSADLELQNSPCMRLQRNMDEKAVVGVYLPQCTPDGGFEPMQCRGSTGVCWCVDFDGREIEGSKTRNPDKPNCRNIVVEPSRGKKQHYESRPGSEQELPYPTDSDNILIDSDRATSTELSNKIAAMPESDIEIDTVDLSTNQVGMLPSRSDLHVPASAVMSQPGILAGIIGGALVGLLCAVLLVMFIVYRMRKKDEGSYALDERKHSPSMHTYARAPTKEFYA